MYFKQKDIFKDMNKNFLKKETQRINFTYCLEDA
jgi:hypothetical protein